MSDQDKISPNNVNTLLSDENEEKYQSWDY